MFRIKVGSSDRRFCGSLLPAISVAAALLALSTIVLAQQVPTVLFTAGAYGTTATVAGVVSVARTAPVGVGSGCGTAKVPASQTGTVASLTALPLLTTGAVNTTASDTSGMATGSADVYQVSLLGGLISAQEVKSVSTTVDNNQTLSSSAAGSTFVNLNVLGQLINGLPNPNTTINLAGFGKVVLNEQIKSNANSTARLTVNMIHVYISVANILNIPVGAQIIVSDASSGIMLVSGPGALDGTAYGTAVYGKLLQSSPTAVEGVPCQGTKGVVRTNTLVGLNLPVILTSGTVVDSAEGNTTANNSNSQTSSTIQGLSLLSGLITASVINAEADGSTADGVTFNWGSHGSFVNIVVAGHPEITDNVTPNTQVKIANLGTLYLNRVRTGNDFIENRMIELVVNQNNTLGLPLGLDIVIGYAEASLHSETHP
jgi:hypothetical protein